MITLKINMYFFVAILLSTIIGSAAIGFGFGIRSATKYYNNRCMKYFGFKGYPADGYCKLFVGDIKARDEE